MNKRMKHIYELTRHATRIEIKTLTRLLIRETPCDEKLKDRIEKKIEALEYLDNDDNTDVQRYEINDNETVIVLEPHKDYYDCICFKCGNIKDTIHIDGCSYCGAHNKLGEIVMGCPDYIRLE